MVDVIWQPVADAMPVLPLFFTRNTVAFGASPHGVGLLEPKWLRLTRPDYDNIIVKYVNRNINIKYLCWKTSRTSILTYRDTRHIIYYYMCNTTIIYTIRIGTDTPSYINFIIVVE